MEQLVHALTELALKSDADNHLVLNVLSSVGENVVTIVVDNLAEFILEGNDEQRTKAALVIANLIEDHGYTLTPPVRLEAEAQQ